MIACICSGLSVVGRAEGISRLYVDMQGQKELIGIWKACRLSSCLSRPSSDITWEEICFATNGIVSIVLKEGEGNAVRRMVGAYTLHNKAEAGYAPKREIRIDLKNTRGGSTVVLHNVRIGEFSCFPRGKYVLWFRDESGKDCVYEPFTIEMVNTNRYIEVNDSPSGCPVSSPVSKHERKGVRLSQKLCKDLIRAAPDMYKQHKAILRIMNEGDSSCVSALIPFTMPDKDSLLRQDAVKALGTIGSHSAVSRLIEMIQSPVMSRAYDEEEDEAAQEKPKVRPRRKKPSGSADGENTPDDSAEQS